MAFGSDRGPSGVRPEINITPLVDVVLVLLIIFMVMTPTLLKEVDLKVPDTTAVETGATPSPNEEVIVTVKSTGKIELNHEPVEASQLGARVRDEMSRRAEKRIFFDVDDEANYGDALQVMDICRGAGVRTLGLITQ